jgi:protein phosphatase
VLEESEVFMNTQQNMLTRKLYLQASALTDSGQERPSNEDAVFQSTEYTDNGENLGLYVVCDGLGGHEAGDVASHLVIETLVTAFHEWIQFEEVGGTITLPYPLTTQKVKNWLRGTLLKANDRIRNILDEGEIGKMGTTVNAALIYNDYAFIANVGDSRTYLWQEGTLFQITSDNSVVNELVRKNAVSAEEAHSHAMRNILTRALNGSESLEIDIYERVLQPGNKLLLCSDGLWHAYPHAEELAQRMAQAPDPGSLCWQLVQEAKQRDGSDNISAVAVYLHMGKRIKG